MIIPDLRAAAAGHAEWWLIGGVAVALLELIIPGIELVWIGGAALAVGVVALAVPGFPAAAQFAVFAGVAAALIALARRATRHRASLEPSSAVNLGSAQFVGERATLVAPIVNGHGSVKLNDVIWPVRGPDLPAGTAVRIRRADGMGLLVERA